MATGITSLDARRFFCEVSKIKEDVVGAAKQHINTLDVRKFDNEDTAIDILSARLCRRAFAVFKKTIAKNYSDAKYANLIDICMSKEIQYFITPYFLREELQQLIREKISS